MSKRSDKYSSLWYELPDGTIGRARVPVNCIRKMNDLINLLKKLSVHEAVDIDRLRSFVRTSYRSGVKQPLGRIYPRKRKLRSNAG